MATRVGERRGKVALDAIKRECAGDCGPPDGLLSRVAERLVSAVTCAVDGWMLLDPQTLMVTGGIRPGDDQVESQTPQAARLLGQAAGREDRTRLPLPVTVYSVAHRARAMAAGHADGPRATGRTRLASGGWLAIEAEPLGGAGEPSARVAVVVQSARPGQLAPVVLAASGLTARERQIARMLLRGESTGQIAAHLVISRHTLRDHVKAIYAKFGVTGRPEFTALLLGEEQGHNAGEIPHRGDTGGGHLGAL